MLQSIQEYISIVEGICVIIGVIVALYQIRQQTEISRADHDRQKKQSTIEFYNSLSAESYQFLDDIKGRVITLSVVNSDKNLRKSVIRYLSKLERFAIGIASEVYDFEILCLMSGRYLSKKCKQFEPYIEEARAVKKNPMLYKEFELLVARIEEHREKYPGQTVTKSLHVKQV